MLVAKSKAPTHWHWLSGKVMGLAAVATEHPEQLREVVLVATLTTLWQAHS